MPKPTVSRDDATHFAWSNGWQLHQTLLADGEQPFEKIWLADDGSTSVHWIEDRVIDLDYFAVQGARRDAIVQTIRNGLETYDRGELGAMLESAEDWDDVLVALHHVAAAAPPEYDPEFYEWLERGFAHEHPDVRKMTAILTSYARWPELRQPLEQLLDDEDAAVRDVARKMLASFSAAEGSG